jgi:formylglycine-generating enzyme required for sulfatase activity
VTGTRVYRWRDGADEHELRLVRVPGTSGEPYGFGAGPQRRPIEIRDFHIGATVVTQALWRHVMREGKAPARPRHPRDDVSWHDITRADGFLDRLNASGIRSAVAGADTHLKFRLPSEAEWEYAARGGPRWRDDLRFSGSNDPDAVAWYGARWSGGRLKWEILKRLKAWRLWDAQRQGSEPTRTHEVAGKAPNQLGLYDMSGNVWEWCQDTCVELDEVPTDGTPATGPGDEQRLRGGCHHNWDIHCTVWWRYGITPDAHDRCIGFRLVLGT